MTRYASARYYLWFGLAAAVLAAALAGLSEWLGWIWIPTAWVASGFLALTAALLLVLFFRPAIEVHAIR